MTDIELSDKSVAMKAMPPRTDKSGARVRQTNGKPVSVPAGKRLDRKLVSLVQPGSPESGRYHRLRHVVEKLHSGKHGLTVAVTSPMSGDGKSVTSINLAGSLSQNRDRRVLLVEMDLRHPFTTVNQYLDVSPDAVGQKGIADWISDDRLSWRQCMYFIQDFNLHVLPAGARVASPYEALSSPRLAMLFAELREQFDYIVVDTAPVNLVTDCQLLEPHVDRFLVVVAAGRTTGKQLDECLGMMQATKMAGLVFNGVEAHEDETHGYY